MRNYKPDSICKQCSYSNTYNHHRCFYTVGETWRGPYSARRYLSKDGLKCKFFSQRKVRYESIYCNA